MASMLEEWNGATSGGIPSEPYGYENDLNISGGDGMDATVFSLSQVCASIFPLLNSQPLTIHRKIQMQCFRSNESLFQ